MLVHKRQSLGSCTSLVGPFALILATTDEVVEPSPLVTMTMMMMIMMMMMMMTTTTTKAVVRQRHSQQSRHSANNG